jgi:integration host factor subunit alpha
MTVTKVRLIDNLVAEGVTSTRAEATEIVNAFFGTIKERLTAGETVKLSGFGVFTVANKHRRLGRNPKNGDKLEISARRIVRFKLSQMLKGEINGR